MFTVGTHSCNHLVLPFSLITVDSNTVVHRPSTHTRPNAHPQTLENLIFFPSLFNVCVKARPPNF